MLGTIAVFVVLPIVRLYDKLFRETTIKQPPSYFDVKKVIDNNSVYVSEYGPMIYRTTDADLDLVRYMAYWEYKVGPTMERKGVIGEKLVDVYREFVKYWYLAKKNDF